MSKITTSDKNYYNHSSRDFIPAACHFNENTIITKNGELLQTIQINGINSEKISKDLFNLRKVVREAISISVHEHKYAFWIHTIRRKTSLDDDAEYYNFFSANVHDIWRRKNYWHDKFVNRLYITIVHDAPDLKIKNFSSLVNSLSSKIITSFEEKFFDRASLELTAVTDNILKHLADYGAQKLGTRFVEGSYYSDMMFLYRRIMQLNEDECTLPTSDISEVLSSYQYAIGNDKIEVIGEEGKKFAAIMSIKEYQEVSADALDRFLQIPVEMVATEVFYFVDKKDVVKKYEDQNYILGVSKDEELKQYKSLDRIFNQQDGTVRFCHRQISFMVIGEDVKALDKQVAQASNALSEIGIVHVREDINLEKTFWAQLPANFSYLARMKPTIMDNTAALASLHNFPTGNQYSPWGRAITLFRTEKGTPYFINFHDKTGKGATCIFGGHKSGKTTLLNFILSEADKYLPYIVYITDDRDSELYVKARGGKWNQDEKNIINPLLCEDNGTNREYLFEFLRIIFNHYFDPLEEEEMNILGSIVDHIFTLPLQERKLSGILGSFRDSDGMEGINKRFAPYLQDGAYYGIFEKEEPLNIATGEIFAVNLEFLSEELFTKKNYPKEKKYLDQFEYNLNILRAVKAGIALAFQNVTASLGPEPKIFVVDNFSEIANLRFYKSLITYCFDRMNENNGVALLTFNVDRMIEVFDADEGENWIDQVNTSFILPSEIPIAGFSKMLKLDSSEFRKLTSMSSAQNIFLIRQDQKTVASELSIGGHPGLLGILSSSETEREIYDEVVKEYGDEKPEEWVEILYEKIENLVR